MKIGLSLSACVADIAKGRVDRRDVLAIVASTLAPDNGSWVSLMGRYSNTYWKSFPEAVAIATDLRNAGLIVQPRAAGRGTPSIAGGHWIEVASIDPIEA